MITDRSVKTMITSTIIAIRDVLKDTIKFEIRSNSSIGTKMTELKIAKGPSQSFLDYILTVIAMLFVMSTATSAIITNKGVHTNATNTDGTKCTVIKRCDKMAEFKFVQGSSQCLLYKLHNVIAALSVITMLTSTTITTRGVLANVINAVVLCWGFTAQSTTRSCRAGQLIVVLFLGRLRPSKRITSIKRGRPRQ